MKIIIIRTTFAGGELFEASKKPVEVDDKIGLELIKLKRAKADSVVPEAKTSDSE